ncbi:MAG: copper resistance protein CopC [Gemmatimonadales bacterium]
MKRIRILAMAVALAAAISLPVYAFHNHLTKSTPAEDEELAASPTAIRLWFAEKVEPKFSSITLMTADSAKIEVAKPKATDDPKSVVSDLAAPLAAGTYLVRWRTAGDDGHAVRGTYQFKVK